MYLTAENIDDDLQTKYIGRKIIYFDTIDSTNAYAKRIGETCEEGTVITCEKQEMGRGRLGRQWESQKGSLCMTIVLRPNINISHVSKITQVCAAAVSEALNEYGIEVQIKWPNDLKLGNKKICGILTEMKTENNNLLFVAIGIGLNVYNVFEESPEDIKKVATSIFVETGKKLNRSSLAARIMNNFEYLYEEFINGNFNVSLDICKKKSDVIGKPINLINNKTVKKAKAIDLGSDGELVVQYENGKIDSIISGEISIRTIEDR
ncbi:biotin--[acetyl-CoA-carboxylase] ligase [Sedimentibacter sp. MB31-C6]|uniref:biotin--[acetyl-CoA-carboxylase] ligase n=1 Tax=Sedimentibacter sp. MB31-C6 TaxID=3109366 RepID=UPI002DDD9782|nr:biotin--[acetyl-CoA-carboxylase] ligase [Sedimentibacter sp. MB36-C1]WSI04709.1 biotin--[acetyl-CoA-carboxylase] ligase [Sedimentibacter sp. MB36-C1]